MGPAHLHHGAFRRALVALVAAAFLVTALVAPPSNGASSSTVVTATVPSATNLSIAGCSAPGAATDLGTVLPGSSMIAAGDCRVTFGSSNDTARLRLWQRDGAGSAMYRPPTGPLDTSFDGDGILTPASGLRYGVARQADGKLVIVGSSGGNVLVERRLEDGTLDPAFNGGASLVTTVDGVGGSASAIAFQPDGAILVGGGRSSLDAFIMRITAAGVVDTSFGTNGARTFASGTNIDVQGIAVQADGKIVGCGNRVGPRDIFTMRLTANGTLDTTWNGTGTAFYNGGTSEVTHGCAFDSAGRLAVGGNDGSAIFLRYRADGTLDPGFAAAGVARIAASTVWEGTNGSGFILDDQDRAYIAGYDDFNDVSIVRVDAAGTADPAWSGDGIALANPGAGTYQGVFVRLDETGRLVVVSEGWDSNYDHAVLRFLDDGTLDTSLDGDGMVHHAVSAGADHPTGLELGTDGAIYTIGVRGASSDILRLETTSVADYAGASSDWDTVAPNDDAFGACLRAVGGGATATWTVDPDATCTASDSDPWYPVAATSGGSTASIATTAAAGTTAATVDLRFGLRAAGSQTPGSYVAPVVFETVAPAT